MAKEILLFDPEKGFYKLEVPEDLEPFPHLLNEAYVLGLSILHEEDDGTFALARIIHDFRGTKGLAMVQIRCLRGFETKSEAFA